LFFAFCLLLFLAPVAADFDLKRWPMWREIITGDRQAPAGYALVELDGKVFEGAREDLGDLRVVDEQGTEVPSKVIVERGESREEERQAGMFDQELAPDGRSSFTLDLGPAPLPHNRLRLETSSHNFTRRVTIAAGDDRRAWAALRGDGFIFDFSRNTAARELSVDYPLSTRRYLRVTIWNKNDEPVVITGASVLSLTERKARLVRLPATLTDRGQDTGLRASVLRLDLGYAKMPSSRLEFQPAVSNFHRHVEVEGSHDQQRWIQIGSGDIFEIQIEQLKPRRLDLDYGEARFRHLQIKVFNYDDQPVRMAEVRVYGHPRHLLIRREPAGSYRLFYGHPSAATPRYDLERLSPFLQLEQLPVLALSDERRNTEFSAPRPEPPWIERQSVWLWATLALAAAVLGALIYRLARLSAGR
jgi:hypothetical protein